MVGERSDQTFVNAVLDGWANGVSTGRLAWQLNATRGVVTGIIARARRAGDPRAALRNQEPPFVEALLDAWADGASERVLAERFGCGRKQLRGIVSRASEACDPRVGSLREKAVADKRQQRSLAADRAAVEIQLARVRARQRELTEARREAEKAATCDDVILAALAAEPRPPGTPWGYPNVEVGAGMIVVPPAAPPPPRDVTATFFGDPPAGRSALDMRRRG